MEHKHAILDYWTKVEFFSPYFLSNVLDPNQNYQTIFSDQPEPFPWEPHEALEENDSANVLAKGYHLYLGLFSAEETADRARHAFCEKPNEWQSIDWKQCAAPASLSCFAKLSLTKFGAPLFKTLSLSTLPWAHGLLLNQKNNLLTMEEYSKSTHRLCKYLHGEFIKGLPKKLVRKPKELNGVLDHEALSKLVESLFQWAGYAPKYYPIALIEPLSHETAPLASELKSELGNDVPILNSFYIQELERAKASLVSIKGKPLDLYLSGTNSERVLLDSEKGKRVILDSLKPANFPKGRWPASADHQQSLMQQFVVNQALSSLANGGLFSVNGPPGTGKTTLLREIIVENIVNRAKALAQFSKAKDVFTGKRAIGFGDRNPVYVSEPHPSVLGFEMLVVSSNNTAVQNLSRDLPLRRQLDSNYSHASYLEKVACRLLNRDKNEVWGLVSASLGNMENCRRTVEGIFIKQSDDEKYPRIWDWAKEYQGDSFIQARQKFLSFLKQYETLTHQQNTLATLHHQVVFGQLDAAIEQAFQSLVREENLADEMTRQLTVFEKEEKETQELYTLLEKRAHLSEKERPGIANRIIRNKNWREWSKKSGEYTQKQMAALEVLHERKTRSIELRKKLEEQQKIVDDKEFELFECSLLAELTKKEYQRMKNIYSDIRLPKNLHEIECSEAQEHSYYQSAELNHIRTELFIASMVLHEAWLAETLLAKGGFRGNLLAISNMLQGKSPTTTDDTRLVWKSVFLLIPLISSTFASVGRLFRHLEPDTLGWVFIDEAGQAVPQAAVGAVWRAKRVLSIGDPFQIEPISPIAPEIVEGMAKQNLKDHLLSWAPSQVSVQNLMDAASKYVSKRHISEIPSWLGAPLRVHRRCMEPMFSIANEIAYEGSMISATTENTECLLPKSCWYDVKGGVSDKQYVPAQGVELIRHLTELIGVISSPDLYVISPFREVIHKIQQLILKDKEFRELFKNRFRGMSLRSWVKESIGTVHSFQGKQAACVFFVLGGDQTTLGSMEWASRKPNLLNVAATRACQRFYIIGDYDLWKQWSFFDIAAQRLERTKPLA